MRGTQERPCPDANERAGVASSGGGWVVALPTWESFQEEDRRRTSEAGFDDHLTKPTDPRELEQLLAKIASEPGG